MSRSNPSDIDRAAEPRDGEHDARTSVVAISVVAAIWLLLVGLLGVYFEVECVHSGDRVQRLLLEESELVDRLRRREMEYNLLLRPDLLEEKLEQEELVSEFFPHAFPVPPEEEATDERGGS